MGARQMLRAYGSSDSCGLMRLSVQREEGVAGFLQYCRFASQAGRPPTQQHAAASSAVLATPPPPRALLCRGVILGNVLVELERFSAWLMAPCTLPFCHSSLRVGCTAL